MAIVKVILKVDNEKYEQFLNFSSSKKVCFIEYKYTPHSNDKVESRAKIFHFSQEVIDEFFDLLEKGLGDSFQKLQILDGAKPWLLTVLYDDGIKKSFYNPNGFDLIVDDIGLSAFLRFHLNLENLLLFDNNETPYSGEKMEAK
ncbi:MAG: hypothetical protein JJE21_02480 [Spirochaetaceae bacterium]|nr:hypothetical protein [Spirochaetaceae bacterium]